MKNWTILYCHCSAYNGMILICPTNESINNAKNDMKFLSRFSIVFSWVIILGKSSEQIQFVIIHYNNELSTVEERKLFVLSNSIIQRCKQIHQQFCMVHHYCHRFVYMTRKLWKMTNWKNDGEKSRGKKLVKEKHAAGTIISTEIKLIQLLKTTRKTTLFLIINSNVHFARL